MDAESPLPLHCLEGRAAPPPILEDLALAAALPPSALRDLFRVLGPCLSEPLPRDIEPLLDHFCRAHEIEGRDLARVIRGCRLLLRNAGLLDLDRALFREDLEKLGGGPLAEALLDGYEAAKAQVRYELAGHELADHGKTLERIVWRVDTMAVSERAGKLGIPVVLLTLHYREGGRAEQITLQVLPPVLRRLASICARLLGTPPR